MPKTEIDQHAADELELYLENDEPLYLQCQAVQLNMLRKQNRGTYNSERALIGFCHVANSAAQKYKREFGSSSRSSYGDFDTATRHAVARSLRDSFEQQLKNGELAHLIKKL
jgi:hypothetical protein